MTIACAKKPSEIIKLRAKAEMKPYTVRITNLYNSSVGSEVPNVWKLQINQINQYVVRFVESWMIKLAIINGNGEGPKYDMSRKKTNYGITGNMEMLGWGRVHNTFTRGLKTSTGRKELSSISSVSKTLLSGKYDSSELRTLIENAKDNLPSTNLSKILLDPKFLIALLTTLVGLQQEFTEFLDTLVRLPLPLKWNLKHWTRYLVNMAKI